MSEGTENQDPTSGNSLTSPPAYRLSLRDLCCLFCCPPCPSNIVAKLAFMPPNSTYSFCSNPNGSKYTFQLSDRTEWPYEMSKLDQIEVFYTRTSRDNRLACMYVRCCPGAKYTLLFCHGNAVDLGQMCAFFNGLGSRLECNVFGYDYSGYGASSGKANEKNLYADIEAAWNALHGKLKVPAQSIVLIDKISRVTSPTLVIHGTEDEVIDFSHGLAIYERCPKSVEPLWVPGAGHNDIELNPVYLERLRRFIAQEVSGVTSRSIVDTSQAS